MLFFKFFPRIFFFNVSESLRRKDLGSNRYPKASGGRIFELVIEWKRSPRGPKKSVGRWSILRTVRLVVGWQLGESAGCWSIGIMASESEEGAPLGASLDTDPRVARLRRHDELYFNYADRSSRERFQATRRSRCSICVFCL